MDASINAQSKELKQKLVQMNYYEILEITENASLEVIKAAYRALAKKYHPDSYTGSEADREKNMAQINEAYATLSDDEKRKCYDKLMKSRHTASNGSCEKAKDYADESVNNHQYKQERHAKEQAYEEYTENGEPSDGKIRYSYEEQHTEEEPDIPGRKSKLRRFFDAVDNELRKNEKIIDDAFYDGMGMTEMELVYRFKKAYGLKRTGYAKALEEKGLLYRNEDGQWIPTSEFNYYWRD